MATKKFDEITKAGREALQKEYEELINVKKPDIIEKINAAKEMGDLSENADYKFSKEELGRIEQRIHEIEYILENSKVVKNKENDKTISIGKTVVARRLDNNKEFTVSIVSKHEVDASDATNLKISPISPIGSALLGHKVGDKIVINVKVPYEVEIIDVTIIK